MSSILASISFREGGHPICSSLSILYRYRSHKINKNKYTGTSPEVMAKGVMKLLEDRINGSTLLVSKTRGSMIYGFSRRV
ncbi:hypothetical protein TNIN_8201 [Trichonephila inaurata madagascariensis]|uniref:Uncharacterized protein n=1 Tax=Trichonephila inaurata madagascariensis TaxID=2747483 RepID=A0A8X7CCV1_9ARAC|nr:hypothetical protein TNIN_8201 [Trichonephila inaurata madagascariensis]